MGGLNVQSTKHKVTRGIAKNPIIRAIRIYRVIFFFRGATMGPDPQWIFLSTTHQKGEPFRKNVSFSKKPYNLSFLQKSVIYPSTGSG